MLYMETDNRHPIESIILDHCPQCGKDPLTGFYTSNIKIKREMDAKTV
jgi:uncharacterized protein (DUF2237 family)